MGDDVSEETKRIGELRLGGGGVGWSTAAAASEFQCLREFDSDNGRGMDTESELRIG
jgi:hypothetical protein